MARPYSKELIDHLLLLCGEEGVEISQRASKAIRFTLRETQPGQDLDNAQRLVGEHCDLLAVLQLLETAGALTAADSDPGHATEKKQRIIKFVDLSVSMGQLPQGCAAEIRALVAADEKFTQSVTTLARSIQALQEKLTDDSRRNLWDLITEGYCQHCGTSTVRTPCYCTNDE